jgi:MFS family permease
LLLGRALRGFVDGYVAVLLPAYLLELGLGGWQVGVLATATLFGSALATLALGAWGHRLAGRALLAGAALLMAATGFSFASASAFWPLLLIAFIGTLNPSSGDVSVFLPLEQARLAACGESRTRVALLARYSLAGTLFAATGALAAALPDLLATQFAWPRLDLLRGMFVLYGIAGLLLWTLYRRLPTSPAARNDTAPLSHSRRIVWRLALLFSIDSFGGGLIVNALLSLWLMQRFGLSLTAAGSFFFWAGLGTAASQLAAPRLAQRIGLVNTMVWTHIPASLCLAAAALAPSAAFALTLLVLRALLSQMDVPARGALVLSLVRPEERTAAASFTAVPRSLASAAAPALGGALFAAGWPAAPLLLCAALKIGYDLALWKSFRHHEPRP